MSQSDLENLQEISERFDELGDALEKFLRSRNTDENTLSDPQIQTMTDIQREFAATLQEGRDSIQTAMRDADANAARRLDATINALNSRLSATQASVLIAAEKVRESLQSAEVSVIESSRNLKRLCSDVSNTSQRVATSVETKDQSFVIFSKEIILVRRLLQRCQFLLGLVLLSILIFCSAFLM